jgi:tRNA/tmRNA/rRNA uracil-C5-methylase (TrmA/RlmC/RlmD family)
MKDPILNEIAAEVEGLRTNPQIRNPKNFIQRSQALDKLDFLQAHVSEQDNGLRKDAETLRLSLEEIDERLFNDLRDQLKNNQEKGQLLKNFLEQYCPMSDEQRAEDYDETDIFLNNLLSSGAIPDETISRDPEMVFFQKTPARIILELISKAQLTSEDVFFDIGSGLGQANILVSLMTSATSIGIEFDPAFCRYAQEQAAVLNLDNVQFINTDARQADYSKGTVFFMYTPFTGNMLQEVLGRIRLQTTGRKIKLFTYGPCTAEVAELNWLINESGSESDFAGLALFVNAD